MNLFHILAVQQSTPGAIKPNRPKKIPAELIAGFLNGDKNPVSALMEYSAMSRLVTTFQECSPHNPQLGMRYASFIWIWMIMLLLYHGHVI